jgi:hypothetical protein
MNVALLDENNICTNIVVCESVEYAEQLFQCTCVEATQENNADIGATYDPITQMFIRPEVLGG